MAEVGFWASSPARSSSCSQTRDSGGVRARRHARRPRHPRRVHDRIFGSRRSSSGGRVWVFAAVGKRGTAVDEEERAMANGQPESGTKDKNYDLITVTHLCLEHVFRLEQYAKDAEQDGDSEVAALFRRMQEHSRRGGEECKRLLRERLKED